MKTLIKTLLPILALVTSFSHAETSTKAMTATASINATCVLAVENITFGQYTPTAGDSFSTGNIAVKCTKGTPVQVALNLEVVGGQNSTDKYAFSEGGGRYSRYMSNSGSRLFYNLFQDAQLTKIFGGTNWFVGTSGTKPSLVGTGETQNIPIYAAMAANQYVKAGNYSENVIALITY